MKLFTGWMVSAGVIFAATVAQAQGLPPNEVGRSPYSVVSDVVGPYAAMPPEAPAPAYGPMVLSPPEIYEIVRESGFSPLGIPRQRGFVYTIAVIDPGGDDGRLVIDARSGRIVRFMPARRMGDNFNDDMTGAYGPVGPLPPVRGVRGPPRPPPSIPRVASRTSSVPLPKAAPRSGEARQVAQPVQQSAAVQAKPAASIPQPAPTAVEARPAAPPILQTQEMPKVQGLE